MKPAKIFSQGLLLLVVLALISSCAKPAKDDSEPLKKTVARYNSAIAEASRAQSIESLIGIATEKRIRKVETFIVAYYDAGFFMDSGLLRMDFVELRAEDKNATVVTREDWTFLWKSIETGEPRGPEEKITYRMKYTLLKEGGKWLIDEAEQIKGATEAR